MKARRGADSRSAVRTADNDTQALNETDTNRTLLESDGASPPSHPNISKHDEMVALMEATPGSKRSIGNMLASVGLMRARFVLSVSSSVMPTSLADKVLPAALVQKAPAAGVPQESEGFRTLATKGAIFLLIAAAIVMASNLALDVASGSKLVGGEGGVTTAEVRSAVSRAVRIAIPQLLIFFLYMINEIVSTIAIGRVGTKEQLAACGLCQMMMSGFLYCFTFGVLGPTDALVSTAWGAGDKELCVAYTSKARLVGAFQVIWLFPIFWFAEPILLMLGQEPEVAVHAIGFCRVLAVAYVPFYFNVSTNWLLKNIGDPMITVWGLLAGNIVHITLAITLVVYGGWGNLGVAMSWSANQLTWKLFQDVYMITCSDLKDQGFVRLFLVDPQLCRTGIWAYVKLAIPSIFASGSEMWFWEIVTMMIGSMSATALAAHVATANVQTVLMMGPQGLISASATVVGTYLGNGDIGMLRAMLTLFPALVFSIWSVVFVFLMIFRADVARLYTQEADVQEAMIMLLSIIAVSGYFNSMQSVTSGCLKGMARHKNVAYIVLGNFYLVALPLAYIFGLRMDFGVYGVYVAFLVGLMSMFGCMTYETAKVDLKEESDKAIARLAANKTT